MAYRGINLAIDSFWMMWEHKKLLIITTFIALAMQIASYVTLNNLVNMGQLGALIAKEQSLPLALIGLFSVSVQYVTTLFAGLISIYTYDVLQNRTPSIRIAFKTVGHRAFSILALSMITLTAQAILSTGTSFGSYIDNVIVVMQFVASIAWSILTYFVLQVLLLSNQSLLGSFSNSFQDAKKSIVEIVEGTIFIYLSNFLVGVPFGLLLYGISLIEIPNVHQAISALMIPFFAFIQVGVWVWINIFATKLYYESRSSN